MIMYKYVDTAIVITITIVITSSTVVTVIMIMFAILVIISEIIAAQALAEACWGKLAFVACLLLNYVAGVAIFRLLQLRLGARKCAVTAPPLGFDA